MPTLELLHERTEGWAAGLRLAALSLPRVSLSGAVRGGVLRSERTVAEYPLAEVLDRQGEAGAAAAAGNERAGAGDGASQRTC